MIGAEAVCQILSVDVIRVKPDEKMYYDRLKKKMKAQFLKDRRPEKRAKLLSA